MPHQFSLPLVAVDVLHEQLKLGRAPAPFEVPFTGATTAERAQVRGAVFRELEARGLAGRGRLDPDLELALTTLSRARVAITAVAQLDGGEQLFARAATDGQYGVVVKRDGNSMTFTEARPTAIVPGIVDLLPVTSAAAGQSVTVAKPAKRAKHRLEEDNSYDPFANVSRPRSTAPAQLRVVERIFQKPKLRVGQFGAVVEGKRLTPTAWFDTDEGRYFVTSRSAEDGQSWLTYAPADNARITHHLAEQLQTYA